MLIPMETLLKNHRDMKIKGIIHIGAHECEELFAYNSVGIPNNRIIWIEANPVIHQQQAASRPYLRLYQAAISDKEGETVSFIITNNGQSSSLLELEEHKKEHPHVVESKRIPLQTTTMDRFLQQHHIDMKHYNFLNIDIQGAELMALKGMQEHLKHVDYLYLEVNIKHLYRNCALLAEMDDFLSLAGFRRYDTCLTQHGWGDAFYKRTLS